MNPDFFTDMMTRIAITIAIEDGILCYLLLARPKHAYLKNPVFIAVGMILVTIVSLGIQLWFVMQRIAV